MVFMLKRKGNDNQPLELLGALPWSWISWRASLATQGPWRNQCGCENQRIISRLAALPGWKRRCVGLLFVYFSSWDDELKKQSRQCVLNANFVHGVLELNKVCRIMRRATSLTPSSYKMLLHPAFVLLMGKLKLTDVDIKKNKQKRHFLVESRRHGG